MAEFIVMPKMGLTMTKGMLTNWRKKEGDLVNKGDILFDVETDKITNKVEAQRSGVLRKILVDKETVNVFTPVGIIGTADEDISELLKEAAKELGKEDIQTVEAPKEAEKPAPARQGGERVKISPRAKKIAKDLNVDYNLVTGTGPDGAITEEDIRKFAEGPKAKVSPTAAVLADQLGVDIHKIEKDNRIMKADVIKYKIDESLAKYAEPREDRQPMSNMRKIIAERMLHSVQTSPTVTYNIKVDTSAMKRLRDELMDKLKVSYTDMLVKIVSHVLLDFPLLNSTLDGNEIITRNYVNMGVAVALPAGLVVPVIKFANVKGLKEISSEIKNLSERAKTNDLLPDELTGGTFTISNLGMFGIESFTPIINQPEVAILGVNAINKESVVVNDELVIKPMMNLSLTADHRVVDGAVAAEFLAKLKEYLEKPGLLLL
ncbi:MAG TPA: 2-oxo acid dehydrogenase subunit E2 [Tissierellia bacterium]|jgi:pyruvate dehydrogenase E2 component (dihydrolipoamide acetyltransferase)|nr:2-oxo acid dehydrogenase subunit E2 [Sedimentibacter sp.]HHY99857.1 2-oxo acid dehydrogenase subunit E2 [Tissierellia bacterium]